MKTWMLLWNPKYFEWIGLDGYEELKQEIEQTGKAYTKWTCGNTRSIEEGDRIFLVRLGTEPKGIVASGNAVTNSFRGAHFDPQKRVENKKVNRIYIKFDKVLNYKTDEILTHEKLLLISKNYRWLPQASGVLIPEDIAESLENEWKKY